MDDSGLSILNTEIDMTLPAFWESYYTGKDQYIKLLSMKQYFQKVATIYEKGKIKKHSNVVSDIAPYLDGFSAQYPAAPGIPGHQLQHFLDLLKFTDGYLSQFPEIATIINNDLVPRLVEISTNFLDSLHDIKAQVNEATQKYNAVKSKFLFYSNNASTAWEACQKIKPPKLSLSKHFKLKPESSSIVMSYLQFSNSALIYSTYLNNIHAHYTNFLRNKITKITHLIHTLNNDLYILILNITPLVNNVADELAEIHRYSDPQATHLTVDFATFLQRRGIVRSALQIAKFEPVQMSWESDCFISPVSIYGSYTPQLPVYVAMATYDYTPPENENPGSKLKKLSLKKGQLIGLYDYGLFEWSIGCVGGDKTIGFIPRQLIKILVGKSTYVVVPHIAETEEELTVSAGDILLIKGQHGDNAKLCQNLAGKIGIVSHSYLLM